MFKFPTFRRLARYALLTVAALVAVVLIVPLSIDLGPSLRVVAEREGSKFIERPMHIGRLSVRLLTGAFVIEDLRIDGLNPGDRPFLTAKKIAVVMSWRTLLNREVLVRSVEMTDWRMLVETFPNGRHNFPRFTRGPAQGGPKRFVTTVRVVRATRGEFGFEDHVTPWSTIARNLEVIVQKDTGYGGRASFSNGTVQIQSYEPMRADMTTRFTIDGGRVILNEIDLITDGAKSDVTGEVDLGRWPEQFYRVRSRIQLPRMREIFFARESFSLSGQMDFSGTFKLFKGGRELRGGFESQLAGINAYRFSNLRGVVIWLPDRLVVPEASAGVYGGTSRFSYAMAPLGQKGVRAIARLDATYTDVDLAAFTDFLETKGIRLAGRASGHNLLEWPLGRWAEHRGEGRITARPPPGAQVLGRTIPAELASEQERLGPEMRPIEPHPALGHVPVGADITYTFGPDLVIVRQSHVATAKTYVSFDGQTAYGQRSRIPFHVTSADWQESDRIFAGVLTAFGSSTRVIPIGGSGTFDGVMLNAFNNPRIEGQFAGERMRAWDVEWGAARGDAVIENAYVDVSNAVITRGDSEIRADGRFSLGYPRKDRGEELNAVVRIVRRPLADLRHAFELDEYPVDGLLSGEFHVYGGYQTPFGFGTMRIEAGEAYGESFESAVAGLRFEGKGVRLDGIDVRKGNGTVTGAAFVGWDGTYSFNADGRGIPLESIAAASFPRTPLTGTLQFAASGGGAFTDPRYDVRARLDDLFISDEGVGQVTGRIGVRGELMTIELEAASPRLAVSGSGRIALTPQADSELTFRFTDSSLDPYVRAFEPRLSPFTTAVASGSIRVLGELSDIDQLRVDGSIDSLDLRLFDYRVKNAGPIQVALDRHVVRIAQMRLAGEGTNLELTGDIGLHEERIAVLATGDTNLGLLQGFFRDIRSAGQATLKARIEGPLRAPLFSGSATIANGRLRHFSLPHSLEAINGRVSFDGTGVRIDDLVGRLGGGQVRLGGRMALSGFAPGPLNLTAVGEQMQLRYPEGVRSVVDADLTVRGDIASPLLAGTVTVRSAVWTRGFNTEGAELFALGGESVPSAPQPAETGYPVRFDIRIFAPGTLRIENRMARIVSSAELTLRGTYDRPVLLGRAEIDRGEVLFEGNRYVVTRGTIDFSNPARIEPFFDIEAETRVRAPGQIYRIVFQAAGTMDRFVPELSSDPPLPVVDILALLFGDTRDPSNPELRSLQSPETTEQQLLRARAARLLASPISSQVGRAVEETLGATVTIAPSLGDPSSQQSARLQPTARLTIGKRISERVYLTFSRSLATSTRDQIILLEYDQSDRISWIVTQNEDRTYSLDFRVRHVF